MMIIFNMRFAVCFYILFLWVGLSASARTVEGVVECDGRGIKGVVVTDGVNFTRTDRKGLFRFKINDEAEFVHIVTPSGYVTDWTSGVPQFYQRTAGQDSFRFSLSRYGSQSDYDMVVMADPQIYDRNHLQKFRGAPMDDLCETVSVLEKGTVGLVLGDICWDRPEFLTEYKKEIVRTGIPFYPVIGNHDHMYWCKGDMASSAAYRDAMGPENYAFFLGQDVVIVLDNIMYDTDFALSLGYAPHVLDWVAGVMDYVPADAHVIIAQHANCIRQTGRIHGLDKLLSLLDRHETLILSGHTHINGNTVLSGTAVEHNVAAICGAWWDTIHSIDGTPRGYKVYSKKDDCLVWYYKPVDYGTDHIAEVYLPDQTTVNPGRIAVNVWDWDQEWTVELYQNGSLVCPMSPAFEISPVYVKEIAAAYASYGEEILQWKRERPCGHCFVADVPQGTGPVKIVVRSRFGDIWETTVEL